jgi:hypothetical protein
MHAVAVELLPVLEWWGGHVHKGFLFCQAQHLECVLSQRAGPLPAQVTACTLQLCAHPMVAMVMVAWVRSRQAHHWCTIVTSLGFLFVRWWPCTALLLALPALHLL